MTHNENQQTLNPSEGQMLLVFGLRDAPGQEFEEYVTDTHEARLLLKHRADMVEWASLFDAEGEYLATTEMLI